MATRELPELQPSYHIQRHRQVLPNEYIRKAFSSYSPPSIGRLPLRPDRSELSHMATLNWKQAEKYNMNRTILSGSDHLWSGWSWAHYCLQLWCSLSARLWLDLDWTRVSHCDWGVSKLFQQRTRQQICRLWGPRMILTTYPAFCFNNPWNSHSSWAI